MVTVLRARDEEGPAMHDVRREVTTSIEPLVAPIAPAHTSPTKAQTDDTHEEWLHADLGSAVVAVGEPSPIGDDRARATGQVMDRGRRLGSDHRVDHASGDRHVKDALSAASVRDALLLAKLTPPPLDERLIHRTQLVDQLVANEAAAVVVITAPAGSGKSTVLAEWAATDPRQFIWLSLSTDDGEPIALFDLLAHGVGRAVGIDPAEFLVSTPEISILGQVVPRLVAALQSATERLVLVIDNLHEVTSYDSRDAIDLLVDHLPSGVQLAASSREPVWLATPRRLVRGELFELGPADLAFDREEAAQLAEVVTGSERPDESELDAIIASTEGWAAGVFLTALAMRRNEYRPAHPSRSVAARDATSNYIRSEVLSHLALDDVKFLRRSAVLDLMSAPLCEAVVGAGSAEMLASLAKRFLFVTPVDERGVWYRAHPLFRAALLDDLVLHDALLVPVLHARASEWWEANGSIDEAIAHAVAAGQRQRAANLAARNIIAAYYTGRLRAAETWLQQIGEEATVANPMLAVLAGWIAALTGRATEALYWLDRADRCADSEEPHEGGPAFESVRSALRGFVCAHGVDEMAIDGSMVVELEPSWSPWATIGHGLLASARWLQGDLHEARACYSDGIDVAAQTQAWVPLTRWLAYRAFVNMDDGDWDGAAEDVGRALAMIDAKKLSEYATSANAYAAASRLALHRGDVDGARLALVKAMPLRVLVTWASPWASLILRVQLVEAHLTLGDARGARIILREIDDVLHHRPKLGLLNDRVERIRDTLSTIGVGAPTSTLSAAELRLLPYLQTHITMGAIGARLFVSRNTVATQAKSIYRKLGASSRSEAVQRAREMGLLPDSTTI